MAHEKHNERVEWSQNEEPKVSKEMLADPWGIARDANDTTNDW